MSAGSLAPFAAGDRLGRYELIAVVGGGGFASVWRARSQGLGGFEREVAIKVMRADRASQKRFKDMLLDEARLVARIQHPNVTQIWEVGEDPRSLYIVMELVKGRSLDELRTQAEEAGKVLPIRAVFRILADACAGLHAAHELAADDGVALSIVHRDISPQNILVSRHGVAKVIDFGIAKARERISADTTSGMIKGKISYMAPEQARSEDVDRRADIWAIGAVAYDLLEGKPPCDAPNEVGRLTALVTSNPVPPMSDRVPEPLRRVIAHTLEKDPSSRYPTALALKDAIEEALIESELETSANEAAKLLAPFLEAGASTSVSPVAGASSTIAAGVPTAQAAAVSGEAVREATVELPMRRVGLRAPLGIAAAATIGIGSLLWLTREAPTAPGAQATSSPSVSSASTTLSSAPTSSASLPGSAAPSVSADLGSGASAEPLTTAGPEPKPSTDATAVLAPGPSVVKVNPGAGTKPAEAKPPRPPVEPGVPTKPPFDENAIE